MDRIRMSLRVCQIRLRKTFTTPRFYVALLWIAILFHVSAGEYWRHHRDAGFSSGLQRQTESAVSCRHPQEDRKKRDR